MRRKNKRHETKAASPEKSPEKPSRRSSRHSRRRRNASSSPEREEDDKAAAAAAATATATVVKEVKQARSSSPSPVLVTEVIGNNVSLANIEEPSSSKKHNSAVLNEEDKSVVKSADNAEKENTEKPAEAATENKEKGDGAVWKVQSANGAGGEIQKLKICRSFLSKEISSPKRRSRSHRDSSQKGTEESSDCDDHSQSEGSESKSRHRTRTRTVSQSSPTLQDSPKVVCDVSEEKPTKIKIHIGSKSPVATPPSTETDVTVAMVEQVVEEEVIVDSQQVEQVEEVVPETEQEEAQVSKDTEQEAQQTSDDTTQKAITEVVTDAQSIHIIELPVEAAPVEKPNSHTSSPRAEKKQATVNEDHTTEDSDSGTNSDDDHTDDETNAAKKKKKKRRRKSGMMSSVSRQKPISESDQPQRRESSKEEPEEERTAQEEEGARITAEEQHRDHEESAKETSSVTVDKENVAESSRTSPAPAEPVAKKRRWGASKSIRPAKKPVLCISTDSLKNLIPEAKPVPIEEVRLSVEEENEYTEDMEEDQSDGKKESPKEVKKKDKDRKKEKERLKEKEEEEPDEKPDRDEKPERPSTDGMKVNRRICVLSEDDRKLARSPSPPRHRPSDVLFITNLVRPFTIPQLKNLLARTGKIAENGFWIDKIKSKCYVQYSDVEEAIETRHALHGVRWPVSNPRTLCVEFANHDDMAVAQAAAEQEAIPRKTEPLFHSGGDHSVEGWIADQARLNLDRPQRRVREWDVGKPAHPDEALDQLHTPRPDFEDPRDRERRIKKEKGRRSRTPDAHEPIARKQRRKDEDAPAKLLDDLFRKTKVHPCIYWLPLTAEQIVVKEEMRRQHMAEHERRIAEMKKAEQSRRDRDRRDRSRK